MFSLFPCRRIFLLRGQKKHCCSGLLDVQWLQTRTILQIGMPAMATVGNTSKSATPHTSFSKIYRILTRGEVSSLQMILTGKSSFRWWRQIRSCVVPPHRTRLLFRHYLPQWSIHFLCLYKTVRPPTNMLLHQSVQQKMHRFHILPSSQGRISYPRYIVMPYSTFPVPNKPVTRTYPSHNAYGTLM